jgi:hypothetical protein
VAYIVRTKLTKSDDNPWFWADEKNQDLIKDICLSVGQNHVVQNLFASRPENLHEFVWEIPANDENHAQEIVMMLVSWQSQTDSQTLEQINQSLVSVHTDWKEDIVIDPV